MLLDCILTATLVCVREFGIGSSQTDDVYRLVPGGLEEEIGVNKAVSCDVR